MGRSLRRRAGIAGVFLRASCRYSTLPGLHDAAAEWSPHPNTLVLGHSHSGYERALRARKIQCLQSVRGTRGCILDGLSSFIPYLPYSVHSVYVGACSLTSWPIGSANGTLPQVVQTSNSGENVAGMQPAAFRCRLQLPVCTSPYGVVFENTPRRRCRNNSPNLPACGAAWVKPPCMVCRHSLIRRTYGVMMQSLLLGPSSVQYYSI